MAVHQNSGQVSHPAPPAAATRGSAMSPLEHLAEFVDEAAFRTANRKVASSVTVITTRAGKVRHGLTATAVCSVTADPPTMLICVNRSASAEKFIQESGVFAINFLTEEQHKVASLFSTSSLAPEERFAEGQWRSLKTGSPVLEGSLASFDCVVEEMLLQGTHHIYFGRVVAATSLDQGALIYRDGSFRRLAPVG